MPIINFFKKTINNNSLFNITVALPVFPSSELLQEIPGWKQSGAFDWRDLNKCATLATPTAAEYVLCNPTRV